MTIHLIQCTRFSIVRPEGAFRVPLRSELSRRVQTLLDRGERRIILDLSHLAAIDAAGIGELVRTFRATRAAGGVLRIARPNRRIRRMLRVAGVLPFLTARHDLPRDEWTVAPNSLRVRELPVEQQTR